MYKSILGAQNDFFKASIKGATLRYMQFNTENRIFERSMLDSYKLGQRQYSKIEGGSPLTPKESVENWMRYSHFEFFGSAPCTTYNLGTISNIPNAIRAAYSTPLGVPKASLVRAEMF